jgi:hypothetical protein
MKRGNLLWEGSRMMLAEHRQLLNNCNVERRDTSKDHLENTQANFEEWQQDWETAVINDLELNIWLADRKQPLTGQVVGCDATQGFLLLRDQSGNEHKICISEIVDLMIR